MSSDILEELSENLRASAARYLGAEASHVLRLRQLDERLLPISIDNVAILAELAGFPDPEQTGADFAIPYLVLLTHCDLLDGAVDGDVTDAQGLLGLANTLAWFWAITEEEILPRLQPDSRAAMRRRMRERLAERSVALRLEAFRRLTWEPPNETDASAAAGRSIGVVLIYDLLCAIAGHDSNPAVVVALSDYLHAFQLGDDLGDWESDLAAGNHTALLRGCAARLGPGVIIDRNALERELFLGGYYELYAARLIHTFDDIIERVANLDVVQSERLRLYIASKRADTLFLLTEVVQSKLDIFASTPPNRSASELRTQRARLHYPLFRRLITASHRQSEYRASYGAIWWWILWQLRLPIYAWYRRHGRSQAEVIYVERGDEILAAVALMPWGLISTAIVVGNPAERKAAMRLLITTIDPILRNSTQHRWAYISTDFRALIAALQHRGFAQRPASHYLVTFPFGPLTWTFATRRSPRLPWPGLRIVEHVLLNRPVQGPAIS